MANNYNVVAIYDQNNNQVFIGATPMQAVVKEGAKVMEHPVENGTVIVDHLVIKPIEIDLPLITQSDDPKSVYDEIKQLYLAGTLLTVQTKSDIYTSLVIESMPHEEKHDVFDQLIIHLKLKEVKFATTQFGTLPPAKVKKKVQQTTQPEGEKQGTTPKVSGAYSSFHYIAKATGFEK